MTETLITSYASPGLHGVDLSLSLSGLTITVPASSVTYKSSSYSLALDEVHTVGSYAVDCLVAGYLVLDTANSNTLRVFVDEVLQDGLDAPYNFENSSYELIAYLYQFTVPSGTTDLSTLDWYRWSIIPEPV